MAQIKVSFYDINGEEEKERRFGAYGYYYVTKYQYMNLHEDDNEKLLVENSLHWMHVGHGMMEEYQVIIVTEQEILLQATGRNTTTSSDWWKKHMMQ